MSGICEQRVAIVTGAGGGLGRAYAIELASQGASVIVNDINHEAAESTVSDILSNGGQAVANNSDITSYDDAFNIVNLALVEYGGLHAVVNNAGICRDRMFASMTEQEWDDVIAVHLKGHFCISSHAVHFWRGESKEGRQVEARIINTSSGAGLNGSIGQSNYAAAKGGIASLTLNQAAELGRYGVTANALAPSARTGMTEEVFAEVMKKPEDGGFDHFDPSNVAPLVAWLASAQSSHVSGRVFEIEGGKMSLADGWRSTEGIDKRRRWAADEIGAGVDQLIATEPSPQKVYGS